MSNNLTSQAVERNEAFSTLKPAEWFCIRQKFQKMEEALKEMEPGTMGSYCVQLAEEALAFDPLS